MALAQVRSAPVHPRACGERTLGETHIPDLFGSSPRLRGTDGWRWRRSDQRRFIPAPAGNGSGRTAIAAFRAVHPRACGERAEAVVACASERGSSPRLRGTDDFKAVL